MHLLGVLGHVMDLLGRHVELARGQVHVGHNPVRRDLGGLRDQVIGVGIFGALGIAAAGASFFEDALDSGKRISKALKQFNKLDQQPATYGIEQLNDSAKNLRSAATDLQQASSGFFGTIINALRGDPIGAAAQDANELASFQEKAARDLQREKNRILRGSTPDALSQQVDQRDALLHPPSAREAEAKKKADRTADVTGLSNIIDISSSDALSSSLDELGKSGRNATDIMAAFQAKLKGIATDGAAATRKLSGLEASTVAKGVASTAVGAFLSLRPSDLSFAASDYGVKHPTKATFKDDFGIGFLARHDSTSFLLPHQDQVDAITRSKLLRSVDTDALGSQIDATVGQFLTQGNDINDPAQKKLLKLSLQASINSVKGVILPPEVRDQIVTDAINGVVTQARTITSVTDSSASYAELAAAIPGLAQAAGAEAGVNLTLAAKPGTVPNESSALTASKETLKQEQEGLETLRSKGLTSAADQAQWDALIAAINEQKVKVADDTVANMQNQFNLLEASKPPENSTQNVKDQIAELQKELAIPGQSDSDISAEKAKLAQLQQQLPGLEIQAGQAGQPRHDRPGQDRASPNPGRTGRLHRSGSRRQAARGQADRTGRRQAQDPQRRSRPGAGRPAEHSGPELGCRHRDRQPGAGSGESRQAARRDRGVPAGPDRGP